MKKINITIFILLISFCTNAQSYDWGFSLGGVNSEEDPHLTKDNNGNLFISGPLMGTRDMDPGPAVYNLTFSGNYSIFISKFNELGKLQWAKTLTTTSYLVTKRVTTDKNGNIYILGVGSGKTDFDPGSNTALDSGNFYFFLLKLDNSGQYIYSKVFKAQLAGSPVNYLSFVKVDNTGGIYCVMTHYQKMDLDPGPDSCIVNSVYLSANVVKLDSTGKFLWGGIIKSNDLCYANGIDVDENQNLYITGAYRSTVDFDLFGGNKTNTSIGFVDIYVAKYNKKGKLINRYSMGTNYEERGQAIKILGSELYLSGKYAANGIDFDPGPNFATNVTGGAQNYYLVKWDTSFNFYWLKNNKGNSSIINICAINIDKRHNITVIGESKGSNDVCLDSSNIITISSSSLNIFIVKYDKNFKFLWQRSFNSGSSATDLKVSDFYEDYWNRINISGNFPSMINFNPNNNSFSYSNGTQDMFFTNLKCITTYDTSISFCDSVISPSKKFIWKANGKYSDTLNGYFSSDSIYRPFLTNRTQYTNNTIKTCYKYRSLSGRIYTASGIYYDTVSNSFGCSNFITTNLTILPNSNVSQKITVCDNFISPSGKYLWTQSGNYQDTLKNYLGCDSIINFDLTVNYTKTSNINVTTCSSYRSPSGKYIYTYSWVFKDTVKTTAGCDSVILINLKILPTNKRTNYITVCSEYQSPSKKYVWKNSGTYSDTLKNIFGCDSVLTIILTINKPSNAILQYQPCLGEKIKVGQKFYVNSGTYYDTLSNYLGCDSFVEIRINQKPAIDLSVTKNSRILSAIKGYSSYQWLECINADQYSVISGEIKDSFNAPDPGSYAVQITDGNCKDTSACIEVFESGISANSEKSIKIYPNPTNSILAIESETEISSLVIMTSDGRLIEFADPDSDYSEIDLSNFTNGIYVLIIKTKSKEILHQIVKVEK